MSLRTHTYGPVCPGCELKLLTAHPYMRDWFHEIKKTRPDAHVSWAFRGQEDQELAFKKGATKDHFPNSPHNRISKSSEKPESLALDLFQLVPLDPDAKTSTDHTSDIAKWTPSWFFAINQENEFKKLPIRWGGKFKILGDFDHFQYVPPSG